MLIHSHSSQRHGLRACAWFGSLIAFAFVSLETQAAHGSPPAQSTAPTSTTPPATTPSSRAASPNPDVTELVGLSFNDAAIAEALQLFSESRVEEAIEGLHKIINDRAQKDQERQRELKLFVAMLQIRSGERTNGKSGEKNFTRGRKAVIEYAKSWREQEIGVRAEVIRLAADKAVNDGTNTFEKLGPKAMWLECLGHVAQDLETRVRDEDKKLGRSISATTLPNAEDCLKKLAKYVEQRNVIRLDRENLTEEMVAHGRELDAAVRKLNDVLGDLISHAETLKRDWQRAGLRTKSTARDKANLAVKVAEQCRSVLDLGLETQRRLCRLFPDACVPTPILPRDVPSRIN